MSGVAPALALTAAAASPADAPPAGSGWFRRKWAPISPWVLGFCAVFGGGCSPSAQPTWGNVGVLWRFGLIRPAKPPRSLQVGFAYVEDGASRYAPRSTVVLVVSIAIAGSRVLMPRARTGGRRGVRDVGGRPSPGGCARCCAKSWPCDTPCCR